MLNCRLLTPQRPIIYQFDLIVRPFSITFCEIFNLQTPLTPIFGIDGQIYLDVTCNL